MTDLQILLLAVIQGLTEFLPISSSGHLILAPHLFGFVDQGLAFDVAVHLGSLIAVIGYFRRDILTIGVGWLRALPARAPSSTESRLGWAIIVGTIPVVVAGLALKPLIESTLRAPWIIAATTIVFGLLLGFSDRLATRERDVDTISLRDAVVVGLAQVLALIPGTSRSGITMTAGLWLGLTREAASRFSFLLAVPTVFASSVLVTRDLLAESGPVDWGALALAVVLSAVSAYITIHLFLRFIERIGMWPFVAYRLALGGLILWLLYS